MSSSNNRLPISNDHSLQRIVNDSTGKNPNSTNSKINTNKMKYSPISSTDSTLPITMSQSNPNKESVKKVRYTHPDENDENDQ